MRPLLYATITALSLGILWREAWAGMPMEAALLLPVGVGWIVALIQGGDPKPSVTETFGSDLPTPVE